MRPMLDIPRTLSSQGVSSTAIAQAVYIHIILLTIACPPPPATTLIENFKIIYASPELINLKIAEAITIKTTKPIINVKYNELYDFLKLF